jgi:hypothetical protein
MAARALLLLLLLLLLLATPLALAAPLASTSTPACRDRLTHPFASSSIWNTAIGSEARYVAADIYTYVPPPPPPPPGTDLCAAGKQDPAQRRGCPGWQSHWTGPDCIQHGCCSVTTPNPDPQHYPWCYAKPGSVLPGKNDPERMYVDQDYFIPTSAADPATPFFDQGWWGSDAECGLDHCCQKTSSKLVGTLPFPQDWTINMTSNNAAAVLLPDRETLVQFQPLVRCTPGSPIFSLPPREFMNWPGKKNLSILGDGIWGAHGGSHLSSIGGTVRKGELLPSAAPIAHALKLMLWAERYYWPGNATVPCYRWPALNCDGPNPCKGCAPGPDSGNFYNGTNVHLRPGSLLAVPPALSPTIDANLTTTLARRILRALTDYGGYLDDNTASNSGAFNIEGGVEEEVAAAYNGLKLNVGPA